MKNKILFLFAFFMLVHSCSSPSSKKNYEQGKNPEVSKAIVPEGQTGHEAKLLAQEQETPLVTEFEFKKGSQTLSPQSKKKLEDISKRALKKGKVEVIKVITWSDQEYPSLKKKELSQEQRRLAKNRNTEIKNYLKRIYPNQDITGRIELISMAERPNLYNKLISSDEAKIKRTLEMSKANTGANEQTLGRPSRSIVLIKLKQ